MAQGWLKAGDRDGTDFLLPTNDAGQRLDFHGLRHTCGAWLSQSDVNAKTVQAVMRHKSITLTFDTYGHLFPGEVSNSLDKLQDFLKAPNDSSNDGSGITKACVDNATECEKDDLPVGSTQTGNFGDNAVECDSMRDDSAEFANCHADAQPHAAWTTNQASHRMNIRFATHADQPGIIALIDEVLQEYEDSICLAGSESDLTDIEKNYFNQGGAFWVIESQPDADCASTILGTHAVKPIPTQPDTCVFTRLYVDSKLRGTEWTHRLMQTNIDWARQQSINRIEFWSDVRFHRAHRFFAKFGFTSNGKIRTQYDSHLPYDETFFFLDL